jgi:hypothetical protein
MEHTATSGNNTITMASIRILCHFPRKSTFGTEIDQLLAAGWRQWFEGWLRAPADRRWTTGDQEGRPSKGMIITITKLPLFVNSAGGKTPPIS